LHCFAVEQPDLNWENPAVVQAVHEVIRFWLDKGVDGFRCDVINFISKAPGYPDAPVVDSLEFQDASTLFANGPRLHEHLKGVGKLLKEYNAFSVGEMPFAKDDQEVLKTVSSKSGEMNMIFQFDM
jgi:glycosidase